MPRYYPYTEDDDRWVEDAEGHDLPDLGTAEREARDSSDYR
jgi:hypothetical protein